MKPIERLFQYLDYRGIKHTRFEKNIGLSNGYLGQQLKRKADLGSGILEQIINNCLDLNIEWLMTGRENMIKDIKQPEGMIETAPDKYEIRDGSLIAALDYFKQVAERQAKDLERLEREVERKDKEIEKLTHEPGEQKKERRLGKVIKMVPHFGIKFITENIILYIYFQYPHMFSESFLDYL